MKTARDIMRHQKLTVEAHDSVKLASDRMKEHDAGVIVVVEEGKVNGILTDRDIVIRCVAEGKDVQTTKVEDIMTSPVVHCMEDDTLVGIVKKINDTHVHRLPVLNHEMELCGLVSIRNVCAADAELGGEAVAMIRA